MSLIVIGFGGSGAKIVQSFIMLASSGALDISEPVKILLVDQDVGNGNTQRASETLKRYMEVRSILQGSDKVPRPFNVDLQTYSTPVWQPLTEADATLEKTFRYDASTSDLSLSSRLMQALYTREQLVDTSLSKGFRGNPNIGVPVFTIKLDFTRDPWKQIDTDMKVGLGKGRLTVVLCGSIFGGTGAAGIPSTCKMLRQRLEKVHKDGVGERRRGHIVLNLLTPYFSIRHQEDGGLQAKGEHFLANSKAALEYYSDAHYLDYCDALYLTGEQDQAPIDIPEAGGLKQRNPAHPVEFFAACNVVRALETTQFASNLVLTQRGSRERYTWQDLPLSSVNKRYTPEFVRSRMSAFARTCFAFLSSSAALDRYAARGTVGDYAWLLDYFKEGANIPPQSQLGPMREMAKAYLEWLGELELSASSMSGKHLAEWFEPDLLVRGSARSCDVALLDPVDPDKIDSIVRPRNNHEIYTYRSLHHDLQRKPKRGSYAGLSGLFTDLYRECGKTFPAFAAGRAGDENG